MSFSGTTTGAIAECAGTISASVEGVFASARVKVVSARTIAGIFG